MDRALVLLLRHRRLPGEVPEPLKFCRKRIDVVNIHRIGMVPSSFG